MADKIILKGATFFGVHGVLPEERVRPQPFVVDVEMDLDLSLAGERDDLDATVNYADVFSLIEGIIEGEHKRLIEALAEEIARTLLTTYPIASVKVSVHKPHAPISGVFADVAVEIERSADRAILS